MSAFGQLVCCHRLRQGRVSLSPVGSKARGLRYGYLLPDGSRLLLASFGDEICKQDMEGHGRKLDQNSTSIE